MKKHLIIATLFLTGIATKVSAQETMYIYNFTSCSVSVTLYALDVCTYTNCAQWVSNSIPVSALGSRGFNAEPGVSLAGSCSPGAGLGWNNGCYAPSCMPTPPATGWSGADVTGTWTTPAKLSVGGCYTGGTSTAMSSDDDCTTTNPTTVTWDTSTPGAIYLDITD